MKRNDSIIQTKRLYLRELTLNDAYAVYKHFSDSQVTRYMDIEPCKSLAEAEEIISFHIQDTGCRYGLFLHDSSQLIGTCGYHCWRHEPTISKAELGFDLSPQYWGKGLMQEGLLHMIRIGFDVMKLDVIEATTDVANTRSQRLLKRLGFAAMGIQADGLLHFALYTPSKNINKGVES
ncbi:GNAT family N-acetyltransferase [Paenibacillus aquistagni]|uniref:GNAT family N-acetyltransferase n=1 Tax=Paenibacillus aquistagni TaxID=1852522 RepID=UPI000B4FD4FA|nr:GNAT family N-acetyltransferase [Paenibacillus aquistagni]NMM52885.1 GNAT family N-acetyltransferase [Paenibacillus aquistagni]